VRREQPASPRGSAPNGKLPSGQLLTADDLAARWQVPKTQVYGMARAGLLPVVRLGRYVRFRLVDVERFEEEGGADA
jgi:excisionase family DNA binding protein